MRRAPNRSVDLITQSIHHLLALSFVQSRSPTYPLAANLVRGCRLHEEVLAGRQLMHFAVFEKTLEDAGRALAVLGYMGTSKTLQVFARGRLIPDISSVTSVLDCYTKASRCSDRAAHCRRVIDDPFEERRRPALTMSFLAHNGTVRSDDAGGPPVERFLFPCSYVLRRPLSLQRGHPSSPFDQIQAHGVAVGADLCPLFKPEQFRKMGTEMTIKGRTFLLPDEAF